jgi:hypothetical protein
MGLAESQKFLARLSTDAALRDRFLDDPVRVAAEFDLSPADAREFEALMPGSIVGFAGSLIRKRRGEVASLLPTTVRALGLERFARLFRQHAQNHVPAGIKKHRDDAIAWADFVAREVNDPPWIGDLARLEARAMLAYDPARRWTWVRLRYHPSDLAQASAETPILSRPSLVAWLRIMPKGRLRRIILARPW